MDKNCIIRKLKQKPKPVPPSNVKRCKIKFVYDEASPDHYNPTIIATAASSRSDKLKNSFTNPSSLHNVLPQNISKKTEVNALCDTVNEKIINNTDLNQEKLIPSCNKLNNAKGNLIFNSAFNERGNFPKLGNEFIPANHLSNPKKCSAQSMTETCENSSVSSNLTVSGTNELRNKKLPENLNSASIALKEGETVRSIKLLKERITDDCTSHRAADIDDELLKKSSKFEGNRMTYTKPFSRRSKPDLEKIRASAYDEYGNLNLKKLTLRDFIYFNPPNNPMIGNQSEDDSDLSDYIESSCGKETETAVAPPQVKGSSCDEEAETVVAAPQVKVDSRGKIVLDRKSLIIPSSIDKKLNNLKKSAIVQENELSDRFKIKKYRKQNSVKSDVKNPQNFSRIWTPEETLKFYRVIDDFGLDFSLLMQEFPYRARKQLKRKFFSEEKVRCKYIDAAMKKRGAVDFEALEKELMEKQLQKEEKEKEKELIIKKREENLYNMGLNNKDVLNKPKAAKIINYIDPDKKGHRPLSEYILKVKKMKACIRDLQSRYLQETGKNKNSSENVYKHEKCVDNELYDKPLLFDLSIPLYEELFGQKEKEKFVYLIKCVDDFNLFIRLTSKMSRNLGKDWRNWVQEKVVNEMLNNKPDGDEENFKSIAYKIKSTIEQQKMEEKLESCYQLFSDPFDQVDPIESDKF